MGCVRIAAAVMSAPLGRTAENLERIERLTAAAAAQGAAIVCFPELNVTGYGLGAAMAAAAEPIPGRASAALAAIAGRHRTVILAGIAERRRRGRPFAAHLVVDPAGRVGVYRKLHLAPPERQTFAAGRRIPLFTAAGLRFGIALCYDAHFPELAQALALSGAEALFMPHASPRGTPREKLSSWGRHLPARAFDNGLFVVAVNQAGENGAGLAFPGCAVVYGPDGRLLAAARDGGEGVLIADLDRAALAALRRHPMRYFLPRRRPALYRRGAAPARRYSRSASPE